MELLTVTNRTTTEVTGTWDGRQYTLGPLKTEAFPESVATAFKRQNPIMGSGDPRDSEIGMTGRMKYKVGIKELKDPCDPLDPLVLQRQGVERWNREKLVGARPSEVVEGDNGLYALARAPLPLDPTIMTRD